jgi:chromatin segregation and condensation protein Rec8/ScpA/Scc1 (kleisin family)
VEKLFYDDRRAYRKKPSDLQEPVETLRMPFRLQLPVTDMEDLLSALEALLKEMARTPASPIEEGVFRAGLEARGVEQDAVAEMLQNYTDKLLSRLDAREPVRFTQLTEGMDSLEVARTFIVLLFLAYEGKVVILQEEDEEDFRLLGVGEQVVG